LTSDPISKQAALKFIILMGVVSLFADMTYEGARSINGPFLASLHANAAIVGFVAGFGELIGYSFRLFSGYLAERTGKYWGITILGYTCNLLAVPLLALAGSWWLAAVFMTVERLGKALRVPAKDAMLSHAGSKMGMGWAFGLHEALDQAGAMLGPLIIAAVLFFKGDYRIGYAVLLIPALLALSFLFIARMKYPHPQSLEVSTQNLESKNLPSAFWIYVLGAALIAAGYADFPLIAYHFQKSSIFSPVWIPISYSLAMGVNVISAPLLGYSYDRIGFILLIPISFVSVIFAPLTFLGGADLAILGVLIWSIGIGAQESLMRAILANLVPKNRRASAYGIFNTAFGIFWFFGSVIMGICYDYSIPLLVSFSVVIQLVGVATLMIVMKKIK